MKVISPDGVVYEGEPVDCRELMQVGGYTKEPTEDEKAANAAKETGQGATSKASTGGYKPDDSKGKDRR